MIILFGRGRKEEKKWARAEADPIKLFEESALSTGAFTEQQLDAARARATAVVKKAVEFATASPSPPRQLVCFRINGLRESNL